MQCSSPIAIALPNGGAIGVPCGKCLACRSARASEWAVRLSHELPYHSQAFFLSLDIAPEFYLPDESLHKRSLQLYFKRLRKKSQGLPGLAFSYYACGEYGDRHGRAHYHSIIFSNLPKPMDFLFFTKFQVAWPFGFARVDPVTPASVRYVCNYVKKKSFGYSRTDFDGRLPPFQLQSSGLGLSWLKDHADELFARKRLTVSGRPVPIPRYYLKKMNELYPERYDKTFSFSDDIRPMAIPGLMKKCAACRDCNLSPQDYKFCPHRQPSYHRELFNRAKFHHQTNNIAF